MDVSSPVKDQGKEEGENELERLRRRKTPKQPNNSNLTIQEQIQVQGNS